MIINEDAERMKQLLTEAITVLCKSGFNFSSHFCVEGLLGITFDSKDIVLLNIKETITVEADLDDSETKEPKSHSRSSVRAGQKKRKRLKRSESLSESDHDDTELPVDTDEDMPSDPIMYHDEELKTPSPVKKRRGSPRQRRVPNKEALQELHVEIHKAKEDSTEKDDRINDSELLTFMASADSKSPTIPQTSSLPEAVKRFSVGDLRRIVVSLVTSEVPEGIGYPGWGKPETKPLWWPNDVPWTKWGVQRGIKRFQLEKLVTEAMNYHGGQLPQPKEKKSSKSPNIRKSTTFDKHQSPEGVNVAEVNEQHVMVEVQQVAQDGSQTLLVTTDRPGKSRLETHVKR